MSNIKERDFSIDVLKFLAVFLIINSHMDNLYTHFKLLATGGAIGDTLFLFCSGYTLLLSKRYIRFDNWYKRRINRIYPSVIVCALMGALFQFNGEINILDIAGGEFIIAIMIYYILIYFIRAHAISKIPLILCCSLVIALITYILFFPYKYETGEKGLYGITTLYRWIPYFSFMLLGSYVGMIHREMKFKPILDFSKMFLCLSLFYGIQFISKIQPIYAPFQIITILPLMGIVFYFYKWCNAEFWHRLYNYQFSHTVIITISSLTISSLCLESYLIQYSLFTTMMNGIFPLNIPLMILIVLLVSFICKCLSRIFIQTFKDENYNWKDIIKLY